MSHDPKPLGGKIISKPVMIFGPLIVICMLLIVKRLVFGLGSVSDLNGGFPWGVWIAFDLLIGTGFACGGWALAWAVYVFNRGQYHPLVRPALLAGRYWNLPYFYIPGHFNVNSVLFETAVCMTIYIGVMALEFAPALFERLGWKVSLQRLNKVMFFIIALGALLPTMHQSSMGSLMISAGYKVHKLTNTISVLLAIFIVLRFGELIYRDKLSLAFAGDFYSVMFWIEVLLMLFPLVVLRVAKLRNDSRMLFLSALSALLGCATWRLTYSLVAFNPGGGYAYFPTWEELLISIGFVAIEICAYIVLIRLLPILPPLKQNDHNRHEASKA
ncbi:MAG: Ni/Fe-hydrogenase cytochrome b subunit [Escherichia coli]|nr:Ni/Fe-hydrogenase cytochrome b subunit [Escherichia coli]